MTTTFAIDVIQTLQPAEVEDFRAFTRNPYLNKGFDAESAGSFFEILYEAVQNGSIEQTNKEDVFNRMFPGKPFVESKLDKLMSELKRLLERFLILQRYVSNENEGNQLLDLAAELRVRRLGARAQQIVDKALKFSDTNLLESLDRFRYRSSLALEEYDWHCQYNKIKGDLQIPQTIAHVSVYYYAQRISLLNHLLLLQKSAMLPASSPVDFEEFTIEAAIVEKSAFLNISLAIHHLLRREDCKVEDFQNLMGKIKSKEKYLSKGILSEFYSYLRNLCVILIDAGHTDLYQALHEINEDNLNRGYFYENSMISPNAMLNITQVSVFARQLSWANSFVEQHKGKITDENEAQDFYQMNRAITLFGEQKYTEALAVIPFNSTYTGYYLMARRLELKIHYELRSDLLEYKVEAFRMFITRAGQKVFSARLRELFITFANFVRQLSQSDGPEAKQRSVLLLKRISEKKVVGERLWLLEKAKELGEKR